MWKWVLPLGLLATGIVFSSRPSTKIASPKTHFLGLLEIEASSEIPIELLVNEEISVELPTFIKGKEVFYIYTQQIIESDIALRIIQLTTARFLIRPKGAPLGITYIITFEAFDVEGELLQESDLYILYF